MINQIQQEKPNAENTGRLIENIRDAQSNAKCMLDDIFEFLDGLHLSNGSKPERLNSTIKKACILEEQLDKIQDYCDQMIDLQNSIYWDVSHD